MKTSLVVLAAGIGSRYGGGIKQLEAVGPNGELIIDYSIHDAIEAGFDKVVFIIRKDLEEDFRRIIGDRVARKTEVAYAFQEIDSLPDGFTCPPERTKPWGTSQALMCAKDVIQEPFAVINADDYYGKSAFKTIHEYLVSTPEKADDGRDNMAMVSFILKNTLSDNGGVTRGICLQDAEGNLTGIDETKNIVKTADGAGVMKESGVIPIDTDSLVSMNFWGFFPGFLRSLEDGFPAFLEKAGDFMKAEYLLPTSVDSMIKDNTAAVKVLTSEDRWFGVTYHEDKQSVKDAFAELIADGVYESPLDLVQK
ncbi:MAG: nucleotidyltransferase [Lachnospiraceae bacterium]|nr:nucleotidyltransferase [Lachnospiraceae bacterium]